MVKVEKDSLLSKLIPNKDVLYVNSFHHQAVKELGKGFSVDAKSDDGIIESIHLKDENQWIFAVQWHPEQQIRKAMILFLYSMNLLNRQKYIEIKINKIFNYL